MQRLFGTGTLGEREKRGRDGPDAFQPRAANPMTLFAANDTWSWLGLQVLDWVVLAAYFVVIMGIASLISFVVAARILL